MKAKSLLLSILLVLAYVAGAKDLVLQIFGDHTGVMIMGIVGLATSMLIAAFKQFYNSSNPTNGWTKAQVIFNVCTFIILIIGMFNSWAADSAVQLSGGFVDVMTKIVIYCNLGISLANTDWSIFKANLEAQLGK